MASFRHVSTRRVYVTLDGELLAEVPDGGPETYKVGDEISIRKEEGESWHSWIIDSLHCELTTVEMRDSHASEKRDEVTAIRHVVTLRDPA